MIIEGGRTFRVTHRFAIIAQQAANSRLFELRNANTSQLVVIHDFRVDWTQTAAHSNAIEDSLDLFKATGFTAVDDTGTVTLTASEMRTASEANAAVIRGVTIAGATAGMTGGTLSLDSGPLLQVPLWLLATLPTAGPVPTATLRFLPRSPYGERALTLAPNEGIVLRNRVLLEAAAGSSVYVSCAWSEVIP